jgi:hypothetical protein
MTDENATAQARTAHTAFYDFFEQVTRDNPQWPGTRTVWINPQAAGGTVDGHILRVMPDGRSRKFEFQVQVPPYVHYCTLQFTTPWPSEPFHGKEQAAMTAWFRLLTDAWDKGLNPQVKFSTGGGRLTNFDVYTQSTLGIGPCFLCYDGNQIIQVYVAQAPFDDLFGITEQSKKNEDLLAASNIDAFSRIACEKYFRRDFKLVGNTPRVTILSGDIKRSGEAFSKTVLQAKIENIDLHGTAH